MFKEIVNSFYRQMDFTRTKNGATDEHLDNTTRNKRAIIRFQVAYATIVRALGTFLSAAAGCGHPLPGLPKQPRWSGGSKGNWVSGEWDEVCTLDKPNYNIPILFDIRSNQGYPEFPGVAPEASSETALLKDSVHGTITPRTATAPSVEELSKGFNFPRPLLNGDTFNIPMKVKGESLYGLDIYCIYRKRETTDPPWFAIEHDSEWVKCGTIRSGTRLAAATNLAVEKFPGTDKWSICSIVKDFTDVPTDDCSVFSGKCPKLYVFITYGTKPLFTLANPQNPYVSVDDSTEVTPNKLREASRSSSGSSRKSVRFSNERDEVQLPNFQDGLGATLASSSDEEILLQNKPILKNILKKNDTFQNRAISQAGASATPEHPKKNEIFSQADASMSPDPSQEDKILSQADALMAPDSSADETVSQSGASQSPEPLRFSLADEDDEEITEDVYEMTLRLTS